MLGHNWALVIPNSVFIQGEPTIRPGPLSSSLSPFQLHLDDRCCLPFLKAIWLHCEAVDKRLFTRRGAQTKSEEKRLLRRFIAKIGAFLGFEDGAY